MARHRYLGSVGANLTGVPFDFITVKVSSEWGSYVMYRFPSLGLWSWSIMKSNHLKSWLVDSWIKNKTFWRWFREKPLQSDSVAKAGSNSRENWTVDYGMEIEQRKQVDLWCYSTWILIALMVKRLEGGLGVNFICLDIFGCFWSTFLGFARVLVSFFLKTVFRDNSIFKTKFDI